MSAHPQARMKASLLSGLLLFVLLILVVINACYVGHVTQALLCRVEALPASATEAALDPMRELAAAFESQMPLLRLTVSYPLLDRIAELIKALEVYALTGAQSEYAATRARLSDAIEDVARSETIWEPSP